MFIRLPQITVKIFSTCLLIYFRATPDLLKDLLSNIIIEVENGNIGKKRIQLMEANTENIKKLAEIENRILNIVSNSDGSDILNDDVASDH